MKATARMKFESELDQVGNTGPTCMALSGQFMDIEGQVLVHQTERYQLSLTYNASC